METDRNNPDLKFTHYNVVNFIREFMKEFRPLSDMIISDLYQYIFRIKQIKEEINEETTLPKSHSLETQKEEIKSSGGGLNEENQNKEATEEPISPNTNDINKVDEQDNDEEYKTPEQIKKRFLFRCV